MEVRYFENPVTGLPTDRQAAQGIPSAKEKRSPISINQFPPGWDNDRVQKLLAELDNRTEEEWVAADEAAAADGDDQAVVTVPRELLPEVRRLLATHKPA